MANNTQTRREWLQTASAALAAMALVPQPEEAAAAEGRPGLKFGMCDWSIGKRDVTAFEIGKQIGLDGIEVSIGEPGNLWLRDAKMQSRYLKVARDVGLTIPSVAMGLLNDVPLMSEPKTALWVADTIDVARKLGAKCILVAMFGKGELREDSPQDMRRVTEVVAELAPRAERAGIVLGLENYLTAEANLKIIEAARSPAVQVYYDVYNSHVSRGYDPVREIKLLGKERICQVHLKEGGQRLGASGKIDWPAVAAALKEVGYAGWLVLETSSPSGNVANDTRANLEYARKTFAAIAG